MESMFTYFQQTITMPLGSLAFMFLTILFTGYSIGENVASYRNSKLLIVLRKAMQDMSMELRFYRLTKDTEEV